MPLNIYVTPVTGEPEFYVATDHEGLSISGTFPWSDRFGPSDDATRFSGYRLGFGEVSPEWRPATRDECMRVAWEALTSEET